MARDTFRVASLLIAGEVLLGGYLAANPCVLPGERLAYEGRATELYQEVGRLGLGSLPIDWIYAAAYGEQYELLRDYCEREIRLSNPEAGSTVGKDDVVELLGPLFLNAEFAQGLGTHFEFFEDDNGLSDDRLLELLNWIAYNPASVDVCYLLAGDESDLIRRAWLQFIWIEISFQRIEQCEQLLLIKPDSLLCEEGMADLEIAIRNLRTSLDGDSPHVSDDKRRRWSDVLNRIVAVLDATAVGEVPGGLLESVSGITPDSGYPESGR